MSHYSDLYPQDTHQSTIQGVSAMFIVLANSAVAIRLVSQWRCSKRFFVDDLAIVIAVVCFESSLTSVAPLELKKIP